jgi:hypothetical protein
MLNLKVSADVARPHLSGLTSMVVYSIKTKFSNLRLQRSVEKFQVVLVCYLEKGWCGDICGKICISICTLITSDKVEKTY